MRPSGDSKPSGYDTALRSSSSSPPFHVWPSSSESHALMCVRFCNRSAGDPFFTSKMRPDSSRRRKKRALMFCTVAACCGVLHVAPPSLEKLSCGWPFVRASIQRRPSFSSTIMCSSNSQSGNCTLPRSVHDAPSSVEANTRAVPEPSASVFPCQTDTGNSHAPSLSTVGLFSVQPSANITGVLHTGFAASGSSQRMNQFVMLAGHLRPWGSPKFWLKKSHKRPFGSVHRLPTCAP